MKEMGVQTARRQNDFSDISYRRARHYVRSWLIMSFDVDLYMIIVELLAIGRVTQRLEW